MNNKPEIGANEWESLMRLATARSRKLTQNDPDADDIAQEAITQLVALNEWPQNPEAWVTTTVTRRVADWHRARARKNKKIAGEALIAGAQVAKKPGKPNDEKDDDKADESFTEILIAPFLHTSHVAFMRDMLDQIHQILSERELLLLVGSYEGLSAQELADMFGYASAGSVRQTISRARQKIEEVRLNYREG